MKQRAGGEAASLRNIAGRPLNEVGLLLGAIPRQHAARSSSRESTAWKHRNEPLCAVLAV